MPRRGSAPGGATRPDDSTADDDEDADDEADDGGDSPPDIGEPIVGTLAQLLDAIAARFDDVTRRPTPAGIDYVVRERLFARLTGNRADFRLRSEIAAAASRTPDAATAAEGPEWVSFAPLRLDRYGADRATAWFELGHRLAAEAARSN